MRNYILLALGTCLVGCGGGGGSSDSSSADSLTALAAASTYSAEANVRYQIYISSYTTSTDSFGSSSDIDISFEQYTELVSQQQLMGNFNVALGCEITYDAFGESDIEVDEDYLALPDSDSISAGEVVTITSPAGTWAELPEDSFFTGYYESVLIESELGVLPENSSLDVPGDVFPQMSNIALLVPEPLTGVEYRENGSMIESLDLASPNTSIHWDKPSGTSNSLIAVIFANYDDNGTSYSICATEDTGHFEFPSATQAQMDEAYAVRGLLRYEIDLTQRDDVLITQIATSSYYQF